MPACPSCGTENPAEARFCLACGAPLTAPAPEIRKTVTIVFADVKGSTALGDRFDPEATRRLMTRWFDDARVTLERHGGTVEKFIGDAVMAVFGMPQLHEDDALRAVRAAVEMRDRLTAVNADLERDFGVQLEIRTGVNTGEVVAGDPDAGHGFVTGDAVNVAARLEQAAQPGEILIGEPTYRLVPDAVDAEPVEPLPLKGKAAAVPARRLLRVRPGAEAFARRLDAPMIGRREELAALLDAFSEAKAERGCRVVTILGEPGIGKSRLAHELESSVHEEATVLRGRCLPYGEGITFWPLVEILREAAHHEVRARIVELLEGDPDAELVADRLAAAIGEAAPGTSTDEIFWAVRRLFERLGRERPLLVVLDDVQWGEATFLDLVEHLAYLSRAAPILLCCLARPELAQTRAGWPGRRVELRPLTGEESTRLIDVLRGDALDAETRGRIEAAAEGNPLFVEQMLAMLEGNGSAEANVPPTIQALLAARLDALDPSARAAVERGAVVGQEFWSGAVRALSDDGGELGSALLDLVRHEFVRPAESTMPGEDAYAFVHLLVRDAAYGGISKALRADLHERLAGWLEAKDDERGTRHDEIIGYHLEQAALYHRELGRPDERLAKAAGRRLAEAGHRAYLRGDIPAAVNLLSRATKLLPAGDETRPGFLLDLAGALVEAGDLARVGAILDQAALSGGETVKARAEIELLLLRFATDVEFPVDAAEAAARAAVEVFEPHDDHAGLARAWLVLGEIGNVRARRADMCEGARRSAEHARLAGDPRAEAEALRLFGGSLVYGSVPAAEGIEQLEEILRRGDLSRMAEAALVSPLATLKAMRGEFAEARELLDRARAVYADLGLAFMQARLGFMSGRVERLAGDLEASERELRDAHELFVEMGERGRSAGIALELADVLCELGRLDEAESVLAAALEVAAADLDSDFAAQGVQGKLLAYRGDGAGAELVREAAARAATTDDYTWRGDAIDNLVGSLRRLNRPQEAALALKEALAVHEAKGNLVAAQQAKVLLEELAAELASERD